MVYDVIVLGTGPAALAAALAVRGRDRSALVVGNRWEDSPLAKAERVDNYLGLPGVTGFELLRQFRAHAEGAGVEFAAGRVVSLMAFQGYALTVGQEVYQGRALILAPGVARQSKYPGEEAFLGKGVSYCATCDGMLYRGKTVVVTGRSAEAPAEANYLNRLDCKVTFVGSSRPAELEDAVAFQKGGKLEVRGEGTVTALVCDGLELPCQGVFILRPAVAATDLLPGLKLEGGSIAVDRAMKTNLDGVFAAGDCTGAPLQAAKAVGEGHVAGLSAAAYCDALR